MVQNRTIVHPSRTSWERCANPRGLLYGRLLTTTSPSWQGNGRARGGVFPRSRRRRYQVLPLERAQETAAPIAEILGLPVVIDARVIEAANYFGGLRLSLRARCAT